MIFAFKTTPLKNDTFQPDENELSKKDPKQCRDCRGLSEMFRLSSCNDNVRGNLENLHISGEIISEVELILFYIYHPTHTGLENP
jgi:hypothetical protein